MSENNNFSVIISTCDNFSDLWEANVKLLNENWKDRNAETFLVTDCPREADLQEVSLICAGEGTEITQRLKYALENVKTKYILFTLDDYFLTKSIDNSVILKDIQMMEDNNLDYLCLFKVSINSLRREKAQKIKNHKKCYVRNCFEGDYKVILYPGLWRTDFMKKTVEETLNAWQYEVALTGMARDLNAKCAVSNNNEFPFLDVIRKGKILRKANRYFKKNPIYSSDREIMKATDEAKITIKTFLRNWLPKGLFKSIKRFMIKRGHTYYSPIED